MMRDGKRGAGKAMKRIFIFGSSVVVASTAACSEPIRAGSGSPLYCAVISLT